MRIILLLLLSITFASANAQIKTITMSDPEKPKVYEYDSLINIRDYETGGYKYLIGQKLYYARTSENPTKFKKYSNRQALKEDEMLGKYFRVIDVLEKNPLENFRDPLILVSESTNDTIQYAGDWEDNRCWVVVGYYEKIKSSYEGKEFIFISDDSGYADADGLINMKTQKRDYSIPKGSKWKCKEVTINLKEDPYTHIKGNRVILILENDELGEYYCYAENKVASLSLTFNNYLLGKFVTPQEYERLKKDEAKRKADLIRRYGAQKGKLISEGIIEVGMTKRMCFDAWGVPEKINTTSSTTGVYEQLVYGAGYYVYLENGIITTIQH